MLIAELQKYVATPSGGAGTGKQRRDLLDSQVAVLDKLLTADVMQNVMEVCIDRAVMGEIHHGGDTGEAGMRDGKAWTGFRERPSVLKSTGRRSLCVFDTALLFSHQVLKDLHA